MYEEGSLRCAVFEKSPKNIHEFNGDEFELFYLNLLSKKLLRKDDDAKIKNK